MSVWILPLPFFSHVLCTAQLGTRIARHGLSVTLFLTKDDRDRLADYPLFSTWEGLQVGILEGCESAVLADTSGNAERFVGSFFDVEDRFGAMVTRAVSEGSPPTCVIVDCCAPRALEPALKHGIYSCFFGPVSATALVVAAYIHRSVSTGVLALPSHWTDKIAQEEFISVPGLDLIKIYDLSDTHHFTDHPFYEAMTTIGMTMMERADAVLVNSFRELEPRGYASLEQYLDSAAVRNKREVPPVWAVGPTFDAPRAISPPLGGGKETELEVVDPCIQFLDSHPTSSVVYVSFGGDVNLSEEQITELVLGLESTEHPFICVIHPPKNSTGRDAQSVVPGDCLTRIASRSLFVKWAPQQQVLAHPSTGAFLTHVGQNSVMEAVSMGVPLIAWPHMNEQRLNCRVMVDVAVLAVEVSPGRLRGELVDRKEVERCVNAVLRSEDGAALRERAQAMKAKAEAALSVHGDTTSNIEALVGRIRDREIPRANGEAGARSTMARSKAAPSHLNGAVETNHAPVQSNST